MSDDLNDNHAAVALVLEPAAYGQAAYFLVESLVHVLIQQAAITRIAAIEAAEVACDALLEVANHAGDTSVATTGSIELLKSLAKTLRADQPG